VLNLNENNPKKIASYREG